MKTFGTRVREYDCANPACDRYHALVELRVTDPDARPKCGGCYRNLRLINERTPMTDAAKQRLRELADRRSNDDQVARGARS